MTGANVGGVRWYQEPLLHFAFLAGLLFALDYFGTQREKEQIVVSQRNIDFLIQQREDLELRELSFAERQATVDQFIEDELLYLEAYKRGLDRSDSRMRRNLLLKMRGLLAGEISEPSEEQLRAWYAENPERFMVPEAWSIEQVFFADLEVVPEALLAQLEAGLDPTTVGEDRLDFRRKLPDAGQRQLVSMLGPSGAKALLAVQAGHWVGPVESPFGVHFVRVTGYRPAYRQSYEKVASYLGGEWMLEKTRQRVEQEVAALREDYDIIIEGTVQ